MGFASGFTGGVAVTLSVAYLTALAHQRNREHQAQIIRSQAIAVQNLVDPIPSVLPPTRSEVAAAQRATSVEVAKDRWNQEVLNAVRWVQHTDWDEVREGLETRAGSVWAGVFGESPQEDAQQARERLEASARKARARAEAKAGEVASAARDAFDTAKDKGEEVELSAENRALEARLRGKKEISKTEKAAEDKASEAKGALASAFAKGKDKAKELVGQAKSAVSSAEGKAAAVPAANPVERALQQRYAKPEAKPNRTVAEVLQERYKPIDQRDNTTLRGL